MKVYQASKLAAGVSKVFPHKITITDNSVTITEPGLFSNKEKTIPFSKIASVNIDSPLIGFSTITIETIPTRTDLIEFVKNFNQNNK